jgi:membrane-bound metal-dependent hydrolase YbcI (DUF457 family)
VSHGLTHAANAAAATMAAAALARSLGLDPGSSLDDLVTVTTSVALIAPGAALIPDVDHPQSTISRTGGIVGRPFAWLIDKVTDHRRETHSLVTAAAVCGALAVAQHFVPAVGVVAATVLTGLALDLRKPGTHLLAAIARFTIAFGIVGVLSRLTDVSGALADFTGLPPVPVGDVTWSHVPLVMFAGWAVACLGDSCTNSGAHLLYAPLPRQLADRFPRLAAAVQRRYHLTSPGRAWAMVPGERHPTEVAIYNGSFVVIAVGALASLGVLDAVEAHYVAPALAEAWRDVVAAVHPAT